MKTARGKGQTAHTIERQAVTANPREKRKELKMKRAAKQKGKDVVVCFCIDEDVLNRFNDYVFLSRATKKKALQTIISEYLDGRGLDECFRETVDGRNRYDLGGIKAEDVIADVMESVESAEGFGMSQAWDVGNALKYLLRAGRKDALDMELGKAENYLHHALTGEWL